jgi:Fe-S-cluster containining protein
MKLDNKLAILDQLYHIYEAFSQSLELACQRYCDHCCTSNVSLTTLEGYKLALDLTASGKSDLWDKLEAASGDERYQPRFTINQLARWCQQGKEIPSEEPHQHRKACPLLKKKECPVYQVRPFGCRCFSSKKICSRSGIAEVDSFIITVNDVFLQYIEHIDSDGYSGNLIDVVTLFKSAANSFAYKQNLLDPAPSGLIHNHPLRVLMIPPEHRQRLQPLLKEIHNIKIPGEKN